MGPGILTRGNTEFTPPQEQEHLIRSKAVAQVYRIRVLQPMRRADNTERFPVLYFTDSDELFGGFASLATMLQTHGEAPRFILVGIGYEDSHSAPLLRMRDLHTHATRSLFMTETRQLADSSLAGGVVDLRTITHTTDACDFLTFVREELMPYIAARYPVIAGENTISDFPPAAVSASTPCSRSRIRSNVTYSRARRPHTAAAILASSWRKRS
jgi:predicted alpha/beta superfamily hydrolase